MKNFGYFENTWAGDWERADMVKLSFKLAITYHAISVALLLFNKDEVEHKNKEREKNKDLQSL